MRLSKSHLIKYVNWFISVTLHDIVHTEKSLTLVFEYLERDLKQYMDDCGGILAMNNVKVRHIFKYSTYTVMKIIVFNKYILINDKKYVATLITFFMIEICTNIEYMNDNRI